MTSEVYELQNGILLKRLRPAYADLIFALIQQNRRYLKKWLPWLDKNTKPLDTLNFIESAEKSFQNNHNPNYAIFEADQLVGVCGMHDIDWMHKRVSIGWWLSEKAQGRGIMTIAAKELVRQAFEDLDLNKVEIQCATENNKSWAIPERLGFKLDGIRRENEWLYDHFVDHKLYSMLKREYLAAK
jgi:ribosomal-protein-serine acetyltransferase